MLGPSHTVSGHPVLLLPVTKTEPESLSSDETDVSETHFEGVSAAGHVCLLAAMLPENNVPIQLNFIVNYVLREMYFVIS